MTELEKYQRLLSEDYPYFIDKYLALGIMQKLKTRGQFCGADYTKLFPVRYRYSRYDHSIVSALMTWHFTHSKKQTIAALLHDLEMPAFSHCIDYVKGDYEKQESAELDLKDILLSSRALLSCLKEDGISVTDMIPITQYSVVDIERPGICVDRLDGVLHTNLIWLQTWELSDIKRVYDNMKLMMNESGKTEIGFSSVEAAEYFYKGAYTYSIVLQQNEDKLMMQLIADVLKGLVQNGLINVEDFYHLSEEDIIRMIKQSEWSSLWDTFNQLTQIERSETIPENSLYMIESFKTKKRYVIPLCEYHGNIVRLNAISKSCQDLLTSYQNYQDSKYAYIKKI